MPLPNLLIAGCQKSGTTWLHFLLRKSPSFFGTEVKELDFFTRTTWESELDAYASNFPSTPGVTYYFESTPHYYCAPYQGVDIAARIRRTLGRPELIVLFRNPVDRYESAYVHHMMRGRLARTPVIDTISNERRMVDLGNYATITDHWLEHFPDINFFLFDDLARKPVLVRRLMNALKLRNDIADEELEFASNTRANKALRLAWDDLPRLAPETRLRLRDLYAPQVERLARMIGRDLSAWLNEEAVDET